MISKRQLRCLLSSGVLVSSVALAVEEPAFNSVLKDGSFEVRDYPALVVAEVIVDGGQKEAANRGFRLLAHYIFGGNRRRGAVATSASAPEEPANEKIAMTAPVTQIQHAGTWTVRFTMPRTYTLDTLPEPDDPKIQLRRLPSERLAVLQFSGLASKKDVDLKSVELVQAIEAHHLRTIGQISLAQYDPPWTPWFMRRNEVMIPVVQTP